VRAFEFIKGKEPMIRQLPPHRPVSPLAARAAGLCAALGLFGAAVPLSAAGRFAGRHAGGRSCFVPLIVVIARRRLLCRLPPPATMATAARESAAWQSLAKAHRAAGPRRPAAV